MNKSSKQQTSYEHQIQDMLTVNQQQTAFYAMPETYHSAGGLIPQLWRKLRDTQNEVRKSIGVDQDIYQLHRQWIGDVSTMKVLDLGCYDGNPLSFELARKAKSYLGIDLSEFAINSLKIKLDKLGVTTARAECVDFLSDEFQESNFDLVYAHSVAHHFEHFEVLLQVLAKRLNPGGKVITLDPLNTSLLAKFLRAAYRPFQPDKDWEWPFNKQTFASIQKYFEIEHIQGTSGRLKWSVPLALFNKKNAIYLGRLLHANDLLKATQMNRALWSCMHVSMCWRKR